MVDGAGSSGNIKQTIKSFVLHRPLEYNNWPREIREKEQDIKNHGAQTKLGFSLLLLCRTRKTLPSNPFAHRSSYFCCCSGGWQAGWNAGRLPWGWCYCKFFQNITRIFIRHPRIFANGNCKIVSSSFDLFVCERNKFLDERCGEFIFTRNGVKQDGVYCEVGVKS